MAAPMLLSLSSFGQFTSLSEQVLVIAVAGVLIAVLISLKRRPSFDLDKIPGPWTRAYPVVGNILECLRPDFHRKLLDWSNQYGGIYRIKFLWQDALIVTDPAALAGIMGRGDGAMDKAALVYAPINRMCTPHGDANLLTSAADDTWKAIRKSVAVSFSMQNIRKKFPLVLGRINQLIARLEALGPAAAIDVSRARCSAACVERVWCAVHITGVEALLQWAAWAGVVVMRAQVYGSLLLTNTAGGAGGVCRLTRRRCVSRWTSSAW
eukprot:GHRQ01031067.1.p1 GENE.GHRQ01031067.1~~GHRQ01031067.1.p1  ORF type:complete len:266 (+),score=74.84 GHRQ01031067.1:158-955(+)